MFMGSAVGSFEMLLIYMFAPLDNFLLMRMGFPLGIILGIKFPPIGPFMTELAKVFAATPARHRRGVSGDDRVPRRAHIARRRDRRVLLALILMLMMRPETRGAASPNSTAR